MLIHIYYTMFTLCIPTINRFDSFLVRYLPEYLKNELISEIIISDETGQDAEKIKATFQHPKLKVFTNETRLGPFLNKLNACKKASNTWIALIDSDNFADEDYFKTAKQFIESNRIPDTSILAPCWAKPRFDYRHLSGYVFTKTTLGPNWQTEMKTNPSFNSEILMNTGNYILNKSIIQNISIQNEFSNIHLSSACDVIYFNTLLFEQMNLHMYVVPDMHYEHVVHDGSIYIQTHQQFKHFTEQVHSRYRALRNYSNTNHTMTLREWQQINKPRNEMLYNCSEFQYLNDEWVPFSIGMGWSIIQYSGDFSKTQRGNHEITVLCAINPNTDIRRRSQTPKNRLVFLENLRKNNIHNTHMESSRYFESLPSYKFVISPEGNGIDCHRHYEALMAGCIPIIENHPGIHEKYKGCPILFTEDYSEITEKYLQEKYKEMLDTEYDFSKLYLSSYTKDEQEQIKQNGNYWSNRLTQRAWYS